MTKLLQTLIVGVQVGAIYGLIALGLALVYKATRVFNFAHGEFGTVAVFSVWLLLPEAAFTPAGGPGVSVSGALFLFAAVGLVVGTAFGMATYLLVVRPLTGRPEVTVLVATAGVALAAVSLQLIMGRAEPRSMPSFIDGRAFTLASVNITWQTVFTIVVLAVVAVALGIFFRTRVGTALLATAQEPFAATLAGISTTTMSLVTWGVAGFLAAAGGLMATASDRLLTPGIMTGKYLIPAFTAAILGGITSMPGAVLGGMLLGVIQASSNNYLPASWPGKPQIGVFVILVAVLLLRPRGLLGKEA